MQTVKVPKSQFHRIVIVTYPGAQALDVFGPADVFDAATRLGAPVPYRIQVVSPSGGLNRLSNGISIDTDSAKTARGRIDTLVVTGGAGPALSDVVLADGVRRLAARSVRVTSVCTGAVILAAAGLLEGRRATTHWGYSKQMQKSFPTVTVEADSIWINDDNVWTSAGVTAGMDLALALVTVDCGPTIAREIARWLVIYMQRPGGQSQFSDRSSPPSALHTDLGILLDWISDHLDHDLRVSTLAVQAAMSPRQLLRRFSEDLKTTPAAYVLEQRLEKVRTLIELTNLDVAAIGRQSGFINVETLHRAFKRKFGTTPARHRELFASSPAQLMS
jgi:transcriptional regulator GlxA family with amidase domain